MTIQLSILEQKLIKEIQSFLPLTAEEIIDEALYQEKTRSSLTQDFYLQSCHSLRPEKKIEYIQYSLLQEPSLEKLEKVVKSIVGNGAISIVDITPRHEKKLMVLLLSLGFNISKTMIFNENLFLSFTRTVTKESESSISSGVRREEALKDLLKRLKWEDLAGPIQIEPWHIRSSWDKPGPNSTRELILRTSFEFGNGAHHGTRAIMANIEYFLKAHDFDTPILDFGCGNGILALACAKLGFIDIEAVDISSSAIQAAKNNSRLNNLEIKLEQTPSKNKKFQMILANLPTTILLKEREQFAELLAKNGEIILAGHDSEQAKEKLIAHYLKNNIFIFVEERIFESSSALKFIKSR